MNSKSVISSAAIALCLLVGSSAFAQGNDGRNDRGRNDQAQRRGQGEDRGHGYQPGHRDNQARQDGERQYQERGAGPDHDLRKGGRLPNEYRSRQYVVDDWRGHRLSAPPRGYHWVQIGGDYVLVSNGNGIIFQLFLN
jgi:Ni/Co efflux regulator RcnB